MKKYITTIGFLFFLVPSAAFATSGACSYHGGVMCSAGAAADGNAICVDGTESSVSYDAMDECTNTSADMCDPSYDTSLLQQYISLPNQSARNLIKTTVASEISSIQEAINTIETSSQSAAAKINAMSAQQVSQCENLQAQENAQEQNNISAFTSAAYSMNPFAHNDPTVQASVQSMQNQYNTTSLNCSAISSAGSAQSQVAITNGNLQIAKLQLCMTTVTALQDQINKADNYCQTTYGSNAVSNSASLSQCGCASGYGMNTSKNACIAVPTCPINSSDLNGSCVANHGYMFKNGQYVANIAPTSPKPVGKYIIVPTISSTTISSTSSTPVMSLNVTATTNPTLPIISTTTESVHSSQPSAKDFWSGIRTFLKGMNPLSWF